VKLGILSIVAGNIASKALGVLREVLFAAWFGAGETAAAFRVAQTGFLMPTHTLIGDTLSAGVLPLYKQLQYEGKDEPRLLVLIACLYGLFFSAVVTALIYIYSDLVVGFIAPGATNSALELASQLLKVMALATPFYILSGILGYIETAYGKYGSIALRPSLINIGSILGAALAVYTGAYNWLAFGLLVSHIVFFCWTLLQFRKIEHFLPNAKPVFNLISQITKRFFFNMLPLLGLPILAQGNVLVERIVSSWLGTNVIPSVDYARFVSETMVNLIAVPLGVLTMSSHSGADKAQSAKHIKEIAFLVVVISFPIAVFTALNSTALVEILFARGKFDSQAVSVTSEILFWIGAGLGFSIAGYYLIKALNSQLRNKEALLITLVASVGNMLVNLTCWNSLGVACLGIGAATYGFIIFVLSVIRLKLVIDLLPLLAWLILGSFIQFAIAEFVLVGFSDPFNLILNAISACMVWVGILLIARPVKEASMPIILKLPLAIRNRLV
jgi:putative peptidoglycan lipid II flippase